MTRTYPDYKIGDVVQYVGPSVSCEADREKYMKGISEGRQFVIGGDYTIVAINNESYGLFVSVQGKGIKGDNIAVEGMSISNFKLKTMQKANLAKELLDGKTMKFIEAGFIDKDFSLTQECITALLEILFIEKQQQLIRLIDSRSVTSHTVVSPGGGGGCDIYKDIAKKNNK